MYGMMNKDDRERAGSMTGAADARHHVIPAPKPQLVKVATIPQDAALAAAARIVARNTELMRRLA